MEKKLQKPYLTKCNLFTGLQGFMARLLSNLVNNLTKGIHKVKFKYGHDNKKFKTWGNKYKDCECCLEYTDALDDLI